MDSFTKSTVIYDKRNVILTYLPQDLTSEEFQQMITPIGKLISYKLVQKTVNGKQMNVGYGFAKYASEENAALAIEKLNGLRMQNKILKVTYARQNNPWIKGSNLYVRGIPKKMTEREVHQLFSKYGSIISVRILYNALDKVKLFSKGVAFVRYNTCAEAFFATKQLKGVHLPDAEQPLELREANCKYFTAPYRYVLYVVNFPMRWGKKELMELFTAYAPIDDVRILTKGKRVYALVVVLGYSNAWSAISAFHGRVFEGQRLDVSFKAANKL